LAKLTRSVPRPGAPRLAPFLCAQGRDNATKIRCEKIVIHACNLVFFLVGILLTIIGAIGVADYNVLSTLLNTQIFYYVLGAGIVTMIFALVGSVAANCVLDADGSNAMMGKILLMVYWIFILAFTLAQVALAISYFVVAGYIEAQPTGNEYIDTNNGHALGFVSKEFDRFLNCSYNYCCSGFTYEDKEFVLMNAANFNLFRADGTIDRESGQGAQKDDSAGRSEAATFILGADNTGEVNFVPPEIEAQWDKQSQTTYTNGEDIPNKATPEAAVKAADDRYIYKKQYYSNFSIYENKIRSNIVIDPTFDVATTLNWASECLFYDPARGNQCWVRWKAQCPNPYKHFNKAGWDHICAFVAKRETWIKPDLDQGQDDNRTPMLDAAMCNQPNATGVYGRNGYKAAAVWKLRKSYPIAIILITIAVLELCLLIATCFVICHRVSGNEAAAGEGGKPVDVTVEQNKQPKQGEGENKTGDEIQDPDI
jgi:hypothetical protein